MSNDNNEIISVIDNIAADYELEFIEPINEIKNNYSYFDKIKLIYNNIKNEFIHLLNKIKGNKSAVIIDYDQDNYVEIKD
jgi:hypothetical protein